MYFYLSILFASIAVVLFFSPDWLLKLDDKNTYLHTLHENAKIVALGCAGLAYYLYAQEKTAATGESSSPSSSSSSSETSEVPSFASTSEQ